MIRLAVSGAAGRMGARICALAHADPRFDVVAALEATGHPDIGSRMERIAGVEGLDLPVQDRTQTECDVLIDFSLPAGTMHWLDFCLVKKCPIVIGTTGHSDEDSTQIEKAAKSIPLLKATNMSLGVNLLFKLAGEIAGALKEGYDIEIVEAHHRFKVDAPSGTAMTLLNEVLKATGRSREKDVVHGRQGETGQRPGPQIGMHALRLGDTVGEHEVFFGGLGETLSIKHTAHTRDTFAKGALEAAAWIVKKPAGRYDMRDVLNL